MLKCQKSDMSCLNFSGVTLSKKPVTSLLKQKYMDAYSALWYNLGNVTFNTM